MKIQKVLIFVAIFSILFNLSKNFLVILNFIQPDDKATILFSVFSILVLSFLYRHKYWIIACILMGINELIKFVMRDSFATYGSIISHENKIIPILALSFTVIILCVSLFYVLKFVWVKKYEDFYFFKKRDK